VQCFGDFRLESVLPPFEISNMDWFRHYFPLDLVLSSPTAPMRRLDIQGLFCLAIEPAVSCAARECLAWLIPSQSITQTSRSAFDRASTAGNHSSASRLACAIGRNPDISEENERTFLGRSSKAAHVFRV
jgi:hypothetical protein